MESLILIVDGLQIDNVPDVFGNGTEVADGTGDANGNDVNERERSLATFMPRKTDSQARTRPDTRKQRARRQAKRIISLPA